MGACNPDAPLDGKGNKLVITKNCMKIKGWAEGAVADLRGAALELPLPPTKFSQFDAVFQKIWQNCILAPPP